jgi:ribonuclease E
MDQEPTSEASATASSSAGTKPAVTEDAPAPPRRRSDWGKVQVKRLEPEAKTAEPKARDATAPTRAPAREPDAAKPERAPRTPADRAPKVEPSASTAESAAPSPDSEVATPSPGSGAPSRRRRGGRGRGGGGARPSATDDAETGSGESEAGAADLDEPTPRSKPRQPNQKQQKGQVAEDAGDGGNGKPPHQRAAKPALPEGAQSGSTAGEAERAENGEAIDGAPKKRRRRRGGRGRGGKKPASPEGAQMAETVETQRDDATPDTASALDGQKKSSRSRSGRAKGGDKSSETRAKKSKPKTLEEQVAAGGPTRGIRSSRSRTGREGRRRREPMTPPPRVTDKVMVITEHGERDQIAVLEEDILVQHYVTRAGATSMVGNVYLGRVQNVLPGMEAAFVDVGRGRNGVLYAGEVNYSPEDIEGPAPRIEQLLKPGQAVMVQVTKDPMGGKGARLTANLSLAGRYIVLAPNQDLQGISRRLGDDARKRLKSMLKRVKPAEHGVIVRTAAEGATEEALETDLRRLLDIWSDIQKEAKKGKAPTVLYEEPELTVRVVRDLFTDEEYKQLVTDSPRVYEKITRYVGEVAPDLAQKMSLHDGPLPAFEEHRIVEQIHKALDKKVWLPSGGYLFIERTEAMTIVDVNTGKSVGKTNLEETVVNTNLEAAREVARQLRLRDIGGIIVIDFIDMLLEKNKKQVEDTMRDALAIDKTRSQVFEIGPLGLMQVTRKRVSSGLVESFSETCPTCEGRGILLTYDVD